ncbi:MAG: YidB family protein [Thermoanaerobaculia bacterium]
MGLLDELVQGGNLGSVADLVAKNPDVLKAAASLLSPSDPSVGGSEGLGGLLSALEGNGLGDLVSSWLGQGGNRPVSADQLTAVLGPDIMSQFARKAGLDTGMAGAALSALLPSLVDRLTPDGEAPETSALDGLLANLI